MKTFTFIYYPKKNEDVESVIKNIEKFYEITIRYELKKDNGFDYYSMSFDYMIDDYKFYVIYVIRKELFKIDDERK